ncbi:hypothetical protein E4K72_00915 [Oxalobacteraceae bacterium OM1]|nr:hypothetical protein E4K72_00915 [Oxalobacteraceae bacterium OM1]
MDLVTRAVAIVPLPLPPNLSFETPEKVVLAFGQFKNVDIGALCYTVRSMERRAIRTGRKVELSSFDSARAKCIQKMIQVANELFLRAGKRPATIYTYFRHFFAFMCWCDESGHADVLLSIEAGRIALRAYVNNLRREIDQHLLSTNTAAAYQDSVRCVLGCYFDEDDFAADANLVVRDQNLTAPTPLPSEADMAATIAWCESLFFGFSDLLIAFRPFPYALKVPPSLGLPKDTLWIFPTQMWHARINRTNLWGVAYDYGLGKIRTVDEVASRFSCLSQAEFAVKNALKVVSAANANPHCLARKSRGSLALRAFLMLFLIVTGVNGAVASEIPWSLELEEQVRHPNCERQGFRSIKWRAHGRTMSFEIGMRYLPHLRKYIELRTFMLNGRTTDLLFFRLPNDPNGDPKPLDVGREVYTFRTEIKRLDPDFLGLMPSQARAAKQAFVQRQTDPVVAAAVMGHSVATALKNYSNGSEADHQDEMNRFFRGVEAAVIEARCEPITVRSVGGCVEPDRPKAIIADPPVPPDCHHGEGCLFCDKFRVHADEIDIRKLLSARYCIRLLAQHERSIEDSERMFGAILRAIDAYIEQIKSVCDAMVERLTHEVEIDGELDSFWSAKFHTLLALGMGA